MLESNFNMKDIGVTNLIENVLDKFKHINFNIVKIPINVRLILQKNEGEGDSQLNCARVLRRMIYDEVYAVSYSMCY